MESSLLGYCVFIFNLGSTLCYSGTLYATHSICDHSYGEVISTFTKISSVMTCVGLCERQPLCVSAVYDEVGNGRCVTNNSTTSVGGNLVSCSTAVVTYVPLIKRACTSNSDCVVVENTECFDEYCRCKNGYSLTPSEGTCTAMCSTYGDTFNAFFNFSLHGLNDLVVEGLTHEECEQTCTTATSFTCRTYEINLSNDRCLLSESTAYTDPGAVMEGDGWLMSHRNCA